MPLPETWDDFEAEGQLFEKRWAAEAKRLGGSIEKEIPSDHGKGLWRNRPEALLEALAEISAAHAVGRRGVSAGLGIGWPFVEDPQKGDKEARMSLLRLAEAIEHLERELVRFREQPFAGLIENRLAHPDMPMDWQMPHEEFTQKARAGRQMYSTLVRDLAAMRVNVRRLVEIATRPGRPGKRDEAETSEMVEEALKKHVPGAVAVLYRPALRAILKRDRVGRNATRRKKAKA